MTESQLTRLTESEGAPVLDRVVREGFPEEVILGRGLKEVTGQARLIVSTQAEGTRKCTRIQKALKRLMNRQTDQAREMRFRLESYKILSWR